MPTNAYQSLMRCLRITPKFSRLSAATGISKSTINLIARGRGNYDACMSTRMRLEDYFTKHEGRVGRPLKKEEKYNNEKHI